MERKIKIGLVLLIIAILFIVIGFLNQQKIERNFSNNNYITNGKFVYVMVPGWPADFKTKIEGADLKTFEVLNDRYSKDKNNVYYFAEKIKEADAKTFESLNKIYGKDKKNIYIGSKIFEKADHETFEIINEMYSRDKNRVFCNDGRIVNKADPETFEDLSEIYGKDKNNIFYWDDVLKDVDYESFNALEYGYAKDKYLVFYNGKIIQNADSNTFEVLEPSRYSGELFKPPIARDKKHVYQGKTILKNEKTGF